MTTTPLTHIVDPHHLKALPAKEIPALAGQIRRFLVDKVCQAGGHLGPNLGVVELTIALHRVFDSPRDRIIFDTGHQAYVHKILTGRQQDFDTLRAAGGLAGYPQRSESEHDHVENSHASTSLAWADGLAKAQQLRGETDRRVVAVIGDGALTGGLAWEALNNLGGSGRPVIVVLNDNGRSYAPTIGGLAEHLSALRSGTASDRNLFHTVGFHYLGPIDGHDVQATETALRHARELNQPVVVHCVTEKGRGYRHAENDEADRMHGVGVLNPVTGTGKAGGAPSWTSLFGKHITELAETRPELVALTASMLRPVGLHRFAQRYPDRIFDVGIAEQFAVTSAAGLAMGGLRPVVCLYATFLNRAIDQVLMDVALHRLPVTFVLDRAGITGPDGPSHHGVWDLALLGQAPGMRVASPRDPVELAALLAEAVDDTGPTALRFPKAAAGPAIKARNRMDGMDVLYRGEHTPLDVLIVSAGVLAEPALQAAALLKQDGLGVTVVDPRWLLPINPALVHLAARHRTVLTVEDGVRIGGLGTALAQACAAAGVRTPVANLGVPPAFLDHGARGDILAACGLDAESIAGAARANLGNSPVAHPSRPGGVLR
ncbi:1-deoxy-D-xylulose-5-phosphate synthase [Crossiella sp. SN42]|uniref:1-deoxy-D-xylulose-5-phosphate synthase n=1 Tax=Crossiella sp. SN42 TaxID=2944808 RepID=UPI00207C631A|nr:1-deoxy-D-xylulose-5-phosphate synthase [Crossiella sp. SN42]MCO1581670.1 1-deoxy-D-xylulose-5-phosphate synthase [Crossiella sp. SN42]